MNTRRTPPIRTGPLTKLAGPLTCALSLVLAAGTGTGIHAQSNDLIVVKETGPRDKRVNMVIIGDGYTAADRSKFLTHMQTVADAVVKDDPLKEYSDYFNIYGIFIASNQTGADIPAQGISRDTYFGASYAGRLLTVDAAKAIKAVNRLVPEADMQFVIVNSDVYGGSGGQVAVANYSSPEIIAHEAQHSFSGLGDEYDYAGVSPWEAPNTTKSTVRTSIRWNHWIMESTPVPTPETQAYAKLGGLFEGAAYNPIGWYRPKQTCRMRENGQPFCEICMETIILSMYDKVSPLDSSFPSVASLTVSLGQVPPLRVKPKQPILHGLAVSWYADGVLQPDVIGNMFTKALPAGNHRVTVRVEDTTHFVRKDAVGLLSDTTGWKVQVSANTGIGNSGSRPVGFETGKGRRALRVDGRQSLERANLEPLALPPR